MAEKEIAPGARVQLAVVEEVLNLCRANSLWPMTFGLACCAIEMMAAGASRFDLDRFGATGSFAQLLRPGCLANFKA